MSSTQRWQGPGPLPYFDSSLRTHFGKIFVAWAFQALPRASRSRTAAAPVSLLPFLESIRSVCDGTQGICLLVRGKSQDFIVDGAEAASPEALTAF